MSDTFNML